MAASLTMSKAADLLASRRLALLLFFAICALSVYGSLLPPREAELIFFKGYGERSLPAARFLGLIDTYRSPVFLALLASLALNLLVCTARRVKPRRLLPDAPAARRGCAAEWLDVLLHFSVLIVLAGGAAKGAWGETLTQNIPVGLSTETALDWGLDAEVPLGFTVHVKERIDDYYPSRARIGVKRADTGAKVALLELGLGSPAAVPGTGVTLTLTGFDRAAARFTLFALADGEEARFALEGKAGKASVATSGPFTFTLVSYRDDLRSVRSLIRIVEGTVVVAEGWLGPNERLAHRGTSVFQTAWGADEFGNPFVGLQFVRDPGAPVFWTGCVLLGALIPAYLFVCRPRGLPRPVDRFDGPPAGPT